MNGELTASPGRSETTARVRHGGGFALGRVLRNVGRLPEVWRCLRQSDDGPALIAAYLGLRALPYPYEFRTPFGDAMTLTTPHDLVTAWVLFYRREYQVDPSCRIVVDAGANIGTFSLLAARVAPESRILALEPFPDTRRRLEAHIARNGLGDRVRCLPWALGKSDGTRRMDDSAVPDQSRGLFGEGTADQGVAVEAVRLETFWEREGLDRVDLLKMDIEGSEHEVIHSTPPEVLRRARAIALEYHNNAPKAPLFARLREAGFRLVRDVPDPHGPDGGVAHFRQ